MLALLMAVAVGWGTLSVPTFAQVTVAASVDETTIGADEVVRYTVEVRGANPSEIETPRPPETEGLVLLQPTPMTSQSVSYVNGQVSQSLGFQWRFRPAGEGRATIGRSRIVIGGRAYSTEPITITVVPQAQRPQRQSRRSPLDEFFSDGTRDGEPQTVGERDLFIRVRPNSRSIFQGQQLSVEYDLYFRDGIQLRGSRLADSWHAEGFWREELELDTQAEARSEVVDGLRYRVVTLKRIAAFPTRSGELRINPLRIETEAALPLQSRGLFTPFFGPVRFQPATIVSPALAITSKPLPPGAPPEFNGAVGAYDISVEVDRKEIELGEPLKYIVRISGTGNISTLTAPALDLPAFITQYDPQVTESVNKKRRLVSGSKTFSYVLMPGTPGNHALPALNWAYFDPEEGRYRRLQAPPVDIRVVGVADAPIAATNLTGSLPLNDIAGMMPAGASSWKRAGRTPLHRLVWPYAAVVLPVMALLLLVGVRMRLDRLAANPALARSRKARPVARRHLRRAHALLQAGEARAFYDEIARAVTRFARNRLNAEMQGLTEAQTNDLLEERGVSEAARNEWRALFAECDRVRFAPVPPVQAELETASRRAEQLIADLDAQLLRTRSRRPRP